MNCAQGGQQGGSDRGHRGYTSVQGTAGTPNPLPIPLVIVFYCAPTLATALNDAPTPTRTLTLALPRCCP